MRRSILKIVFFSFALIFSLYYNSYATDITISTKTTKDTYSLNEKFYVTIDWVENMQASGFVLSYDATKLELVDAFLEEDFYNIDTPGKLIVNWASMNEVDFTNLPFLFKTIGIGDVEISITEVMGFSDGNLVVPDNIDYTTNGSKNITIVNNSYLLNNNLYIRYVKELNENEATNSESISGFRLNENKLLKKDVLGNFNTTDYNVRIFSDKRVELNDDDLVGTGAHIEVYTLPQSFDPIGTEIGELVKFYTTVIYGDTTGDGQINAVDALALIKDINNKIPFTSKEYREAGRIICNSTDNPTAVDALAIIKHANGKYLINQKENLEKEVLSPDTYGDKVEYSVTVGEKTFDDWKIFLDDGEHIYIIMSDYLPNEYFPEGTGVLKEGDYCIYTGNLTPKPESDRKQLFDALSTTSIWEDFAKGIPGATAMGGSTLEQWIQSWNKSGYTKLYTTRNEKGMFIGSAENPTTYKIETSTLENNGYNDSLYFPHQSEFNGCNAYWLISQSAYDAGLECGVISNSYVAMTDGSHNNIGVRPLVCLPSNVKVTKNAAGDGWKLDI